MSKNFNITTNAHEMVVTYRWFKPVAYFLVFFFIAWDSFLVLWYSIGSEEGLLIMMLFPILHVAVGIIGTYYTIALFVNTTELHLTKQSLKMKHTPLPWLGNGKEIDLSKVTQFFVKEKITQGKNGTQRSYQLRYLDQDRNDKSLLPYGMSMEVEEVQKLERLFEDFLGIKDFQVRGEYGGKAVQTTTSSQTFQFPQQQQTADDPLGRTVADLRLRSMVDLRLEPHEVIGFWQYDAKNGTTYKQFRLASAGESTLIFLDTSHPEMAIEEKKVLPFTIQSDASLDTLPEQVSVQGETFHKSQTVDMVKFDKKTNAPLFEGSLAFYSTGNDFVRIELHNGRVEAVFLGKMLDESSFTRILHQGD